MFVGVGAAAVRDLFKRPPPPPPPPPRPPGKSPCIIIFIDEVDLRLAVSAAPGIGGSNDERKQTTQTKLTHGIEMLLRDELRG